MEIQQDDYHFGKNNFSDNDIFYGKNLKENAKERILIK
jgi:hypothetical protein